MSGAAAQPPSPHRASQRAAPARPPGRALITGIAGQDGSLLAELLLSAGYAVTGVDRPGHGQRESGRHDYVPGAVRIVGIDLLDAPSVHGLLEQEQPSEVYHLAASSFVPASWDDPVATAASAPCSTAALLNAIRVLDPSIRFVQASSAAVFGEPREAPQTEETTIAPTTPYGAAKAHALFLGRVYRARFGLHVSGAILYNHESSRRPEQFVTRKITHGAAAIAAGRQRTLELGDLEVRRDWSHAVDAVRALWLMLQAEQAADYVIGSGRAVSVREFAERAFARVGLDWRDHVRVDPALVRHDASLLVADAALARTRLGWRPEVPFEDLVDGMVDADVERMRVREGS